MNLTGKILTLLIFFLSIAFLVMAVMVGATHRNWKEQATINKQRADQAKRSLESVRTKSTTLEKLLNAERVSRTQQLAQIESQLSDARQRYNDKVNELQSTQIISQQALDNLEQSERRLKEQDSEVAQLRQKNKTLIDDIAEQRRKVVNLTSQTFKLQSDLESLDRLKMDLSEQLALKMKIMDANGLTDNDLVDHIPPDVDGVIVRIHSTGDLVAISLGTDDGLIKGHTLDIFRGKRFIGKATVVLAYPNQSACRLDKDFLQAPVAEGDYVTTKF